MRIAEAKEKESTESRAGVDGEKPRVVPSVMPAVDHPRCRGERIVSPVFLGY